MVLFDRLPDGLHLVSADQSHGSYDPAAGRWDVGSLVVGELATLTLVAMVTLDEPDPDLSNNVSEASLFVPSPVAPGPADGPPEPSTHSPPR